MSGEIARVLLRRTTTSGVGDSLNVTNYSARGALNLTRPLSNTNLQPPLGETIARDGNNVISNGRLRMFLFHVLAFAVSALALCINEPAFAPFPDVEQGSFTCSNDPNDTEHLELYLVFSGQCEQHATWYHSLIFNGVDGGRTSVTALESYTLPTGTTSGTMTFHFPVPVTSLAPSGIVHANGYAQDNENWRRLDWYLVSCHVRPW